MHGGNNSLKTRDAGRVADRCIMVIFGASGDLTTRMLLPALYQSGAHQSAAEGVRYPRIRQR